jgi:hypothetical protein
MLHFDFMWDLSSEGIKLDPDLNVDYLGWKPGDIFCFEEVNGTRILKKFDPMEKFIRGRNNEE